MPSLILRCWAFSTTLQNKANFPCTYELGRLTSVLVSAELPSELPPFGSEHSILLRLSLFDPSIAWTS